MKAILAYDANGVTYQALNAREIEFNTVQGAKRAFLAALRKDSESGNLRRFYGYGVRVRCCAYVVGGTGSPFMTAHVTTADA